MSLRTATTLENELALAARFGYRLILTLPSVEFAGETGKAIGSVGPQLNVVFTYEQAARMWDRLAGSDGLLDGQTAD